MTNKKLSKLYSALEALQAQLEEYSQEARDKFEAGSERWQDSEAGQTWSEKTDNLENALEEFESLMGTLSATFEAE